jgi:hypothetical protein
MRLQATPKPHHPSHLESLLGRILSKNITIPAYLFITVSRASHAVCNPYQVTHVALATTLRLQAIEQKWRGRRKVGNDSRKGGGREGGGRRGEGGFG